MKKLRKALMALMAVCILVSGFSFSAYASSGQLRFSDPSTTVGAEVEVTATFTGTVAVQSAEATHTIHPCCVLWKAARLRTIMAR